MEFQGKIIAALEPRKGVNKVSGNEWVVQTFVIESQQDQYPRKCAFDVFGADRLAQMNIQVGEELTVSFDIEAREYQGRWYNSMRAWKVERTPAAQAAPAAPVADPSAPF